MQRGYGGTTFEPVQPERRDRELTLGPFTLAVIGCCLFALCGMCFVFGYSVGRHNAESSSTISVPPPVAPAALGQSATPQSKPAAGQSGYQSPASTDETDTGTASSTDPGAVSSSAASSGVSNTNPVDGAVHTVADNQAPAAQSSSAGTVQPALGSGIMVQIAAVSHPEDADVLVGALRKRGYPVNARRDPTDGLLHVQIGPFANRNDAYAMRQKLLNDGYNAIVQQ